MTLNGQGSKTRSTLHIVYSFACNLSCGHCIFRCGPDIPRTMGLERARAAIEQAAGASIREIVFTGGEPLLHPRELRILIRYATEKGMKTALMTNAAWATSTNRAKECLEDLKVIGLESVTLSTDRYHLLAVPVENLEYALDVANKIGLRAAVKIARLAHDPVAEGLSRSLRNPGTKVLVQEISPLGRAASLRRAVNLKPSRSLTGPGCNTPPVVLPDGNLLTCCNLPARDMTKTDYPFVLGSIHKEPLHSLLDKRCRDPILNALRSNGSGSLLALLGERMSLFRDMDHVQHHSGCDLCFHLFRKLQDKRLLYDMIDDSTPTGHASLGVGL